MIETINRNLLLLKLGGAWKSEKKIQNRIYQTIAVVHSILHVYAFIGCLIEIYVDKELTMQKFSLILFTLCLSGIVISRLIHLLYFHEDFKRILRILDKDLFVDHSIDDEEKEYIVTAENLVRKYSNFDIIACIIGASFVCVSPLFEKLLHVFGLPVPKHMKDYPFPIYVPFDDSDLIVYSCVYLSHVMTSFSILYIWVGSDIMLFSIMLHVCYHFQILGNRVRNLKNEGNVLLTRSNYSGLKNSLEMDKDGDILMDKIKRAILYHNDLFE